MIDKIEDFGLMILEKIKLKKIADWYREHREGMRYLIFGALTTIVNILTYALFASVILKALPSKEVIVNVSEIIAFIVALIFAYVTNRIFVFESRKNKILPEFIKFISCRLLTLGSEVLVMYILVDLIGINEMISKILVQFIVVVLNYILSKIIVFKK